MQDWDEYMEKLKKMNHTQQEEEWQKVREAEEKFYHKKRAIEMYRKYKCPKCDTMMERNAAYYRLHRSFKGKDASEKSNGLWQCPECKFVIFLE